jgi:hypothetical protein
MLDSCVQDSTKYASNKRNSLARDGSLCKNKEEEEVNYGSVRTALIGIRCTHAGLRSR